VTTRNEGPDGASPRAGSRPPASCLVSTSPPPQHLAKQSCSQARRQQSGKICGRARMSTPGSSGGRYTYSSACGALRLAWSHFHLRARLRPQGPRAQNQSGRWKWRSQGGAPRGPSVNPALRSVSCFPGGLLGDLRSPAQSAGSPGGPGER